MANDATYHSTVAVADPELARRPTGPKGDKKRDLSSDEAKEKQEVEAIMAARQRYELDRKSKEREWTESFKMYMSWMDKLVAPFVSNLFIPKTHEAVELLAAFLIGNNQSVNASPEQGAENTMKAKVAGKYLEFVWRKVVKARLKILVWIKQGIVFGNGYMKVGWDAETKKPWMATTAIEDIYADYFEPELQESEYIIHEIRRDPEEVKADTKYDKTDSEGKLIREQVVCGGQPMDTSTEALFDTYDGSFRRAENKGKVLVVEVWCKGVGTEKQRVKTLLPTSLGWRIARDAENPNKWANGEQFRPFSKLRFKTSPLPNRAYDTGMVWPTIGIQKAFNDLMNEYFDAVAMLGSPMWLKRRGARINPQELIRRPGGIITVTDINKDLRYETTGDVKTSTIEMLNRLDREFQEASMVVNLLKGMSQADTATGDALAQNNVQTLLDMLDQNIVDALSEVGQMILAIALQNKEGRESVKLYETDEDVATVEFDPKEIDGMHDVHIAPDRSAGTSNAVKNKQLIDFIGILSGDAETLARYPSAKVKVYKRFLEQGGIGDADHFFEEEAPRSMTGGIPVGTLPGMPPMQGGGAPRLPAPGQGLQPGAIERGAMSVV